MKAKAVWALCVAFAAVVLIGAYVSVINSGHDVLIEIAEEAERCPVGACGPFMPMLAAEIIGNNAGYTSQTQIEWCLGVDDIKPPNIRRGGMIVSVFFEAMRAPCPATVE